MSLPKDYSARKGFPLLTVLTAYFPDAIEALVELCKQGNVQHSVDANAANPFKLAGDRVTWDRSKSMEQTETLMRHLWDHERGRRGSGNIVDADGQLHIIKVLWRAAAEAQLTIEALRAEAWVAPTLPELGPDFGDGPVSEGFEPGFEERCGSQTDAEWCADDLQRAINSVDDGAFPLHPDDVPLPIEVPLGFFSRGE